MSKSQPNMNPHPSANIHPDAKKTFQLHPEQQTAVDQTYNYWQTHPAPPERQYLWNAKPRFGKTLAAYEFAQKIHAERILIITNRPAVSDSWEHDFFKYIAPQTDYIFATAKTTKSTQSSETTKSAPSTKTAKTPLPFDPKSHIYSRTELIRHPGLLARPLIYFISLQDIKGKDIDSQDFKTKNQWIFDLQKGWDLLIIDEGHEGIKTAKTSAVLANLQTAFTLYLSGTPFRAIADQDFSADQIFNWTYLDEQKSYPNRPRLDFEVCSLSSLLTEPIDLAALFQTSGAHFSKPGLVETWLDFMAQLFQTRPDLNHTFWLLSKVDDCKALQQLLTSHPYFRNYTTILAAGKTTKTSAQSPGKTSVTEKPRANTVVKSADSRSYSGQQILSAVRGAIGNQSENTKTITLSCGQLTTGITIPEWSAVFMLYSTHDLSRLSSAQYLQAAFRAQNPAPHLQKTKSYVFDFAPERALTVLQDYAQNLCHLPAEAALNELLHYLEINHLDSAGHSTPLSPTEVINLPRQIIAQEIVDGGFIASNKLFNIQNIFHLSEPARKIISKLSALHKNRLEKSPRPLSLPTTQLDTNGQPRINPEFIKQAFREVLNDPKYHKISHQRRQELYNLAMLESASSQILSAPEDAAQGKTVPENLLPENLSPADRILFENALREIKLSAHRLTRRRQKHEEDDYRDKLRGFSRTIPMLLHVYGEPDFTFADLATKIPDAAFLELTGIFKNEFELLRQEQFFNETNCNLAIREFMRRETKLANYFLPSSTQDIFDFIPLQYGTCVFTPKSTASRLFAQLQSSRPELFTSRNSKFFDPAAKSGLFLAFIVKELYLNSRPKFANDHDCLLHILAHQIYAWSPDEISHRVTLQTVLSFVRASTIQFLPAELAKIHQHFLCFNPLSAQGNVDYEKVQTLINHHWEENMKFDVIISNPPYQLGRRQIYADFYRLAVDLDPELLCMVFPQGWQKPHNHNGLGQLNCAKYKRDPHLASIDNYDQKAAEKLFPNIGTGGVNIVLRDRNFDNHGQIPGLVNGRPSTPLILPLDTSEIAKPAELIPLIEQFKYLPKVESLGSSRKPYGFYADPLRNPVKYHLTLEETRQHPDDVRLFGLFKDGSRGYRYISRSSLPKLSPNLTHYKLFVPKAWGNMATNIGLGGSFSNICVAKPGDACSETFIEFGPFASQAEAINAAKYFMTKFFRALLFLAKDSQNTAKDKYRYVPLPDFSAQFWQSKVKDLDQALFELYDVPPVTREFILRNVQPRSEANIEIL